MSRSILHLAALTCLALACTVIGQSSWAADEHTTTLKHLQELGARVKANFDGTPRYVLLDGAHFTGQWVDGVKRLTGVDSLFVRRLTISDADLETLAGLPDLRWLVVANCGITDNAVPTIASMKALKRLDLYGTQVTPQGTARLAALRPDMTIGKGGVLGLGFLGGGLDILALLGPANKSGLRIGDVVTHCDGKPLTDYESLAKMVRDIPPGGELPLSIKRSGENLAIKVPVLERIDMVMGDSGNDRKEDAMRR